MRNSGLEGRSSPPVDHGQERKKAGEKADEEAARGAGRREWTGTDWNRDYRGGSSFVRFPFFFFWQ